LGIEELGQLPLVDGHLFLKTSRMESRMDAENAEVELGREMRRINIGLIWFDHFDLAADLGSKSDVGVDNDKNGQKYCRNRFSLRSRCEA
jgi:hypothetical protein